MKYELFGYTTINIINYINMTKWFYYDLIKWIQQGCDIEIGLSVVELYLGEIDLIKLPPEIGLLSNLQYLDCFKNYLSTLPPELGNLTNLQYLFVNNNNLTTLPPEICNLTNLIELELHENKLTSLPPELGNLTNLQILTIQYNKLTTLPPEISNLINLRIFSYSNNPIEYIPPNVRRFIDRTRNINKSNNNVYGDAQSVHNSDVQKSINKSIQYILTQKPSFNKDTIKEFIISCPNISNKLIEILLEYSNNQEVHSIYNITFEELLISVISLIEQHQDTKKEIYKILEQEMSDSICKCFTGRLSRLVNCLNGFDPNIQVTISSNGRLNNSL